MYLVSSILCFQSVPLVLSLCLSYLFECSPAFFCLPSQVNLVFLLIWLIYFPFYFGSSLIFCILSNFVSPACRLDCFLDCLIELCVGFHLFSPSSLSVVYIVSVFPCSLLCRLCNCVFLISVKPEFPTFHTLCSLDLGLSNSLN